jgi:hypothetical protein
MAGRNRYIFCIGAAARLSQQFPTTATVIFPGDAEITYPTAKVRIDHHPFPHPPPADLLSDCDDLTGPIRARDMRVL